MYYSSYKLDKKHLKLLINITTKLKMLGFNFQCHCKPKNIFKTNFKLQLGENGLYTDFSTHFLYTAHCMKLLILIVSLLRQN